MEGNAPILKTSSKNLDSFKPCKENPYKEKKEAFSKVNAKNVP